jgi:hypothetical protein
MANRATTRLGELSFAIALCVTLAACVTLPTAEDYDHTVNFSSYSTFAFAQRQRPEVSDLVAAHIEAAIEADLIRRNYRLVSDADTADFIVDFTTSAQERAGTGALSIDVLDQRTHRTIWHGWSTKPLPEGSPADSAKPAQQTAVAVLAWFPPGRLHP